MVIRSKTKFGAGKIDIRNYPHRLRVGESYSQRLWGLLEYNSVCFGATHHVTYQPARPHVTPVRTQSYCEVREGKLSVNVGGY